MKFAGFWVRVAAGFIDSILVFVIIILYIVLVGRFCDLLATSSTVKTVLSIFLPFFFIPPLYLVLMNFKCGATFGKMIFCLRIVTSDNQPIGLKASILRYLGTILSVNILVIGHLIILFDPKKRALHDILCSTLVIQDNPNA